MTSGFFVALARLPAWAVGASPNVVAIAISVPTMRTCMEWAFMSLSPAV
jgi:hypothetical protein